MNLNKFALISVALSSFCPLARAQKKPNVLVFLVDDLRPQLGCYGDEIIQSPNIDALASNGVRFESAYAQEALSGPSRMCLLTGKRPETIGIYSIFTPLRSKHKNMLTMPQFFKNSGYTTVSVGKVYHHAFDDVKSWSIHVPKEGHVWLMSDAKNGIKPPYDDADVEDEAYPDGRTSRDAINILNDLKKKDNPFLMFVGLVKPHLPFNCPKKYWDLYDENQFKIPLRKSPKDMYRLALTNWGELRMYTGMPQEGYVNDSITRKLIHGYNACVSYTDAQVGKVMKALENLDLLDNTMILLVGDHGWKLGEYGAWCKHSNFELDAKVPFIISDFSSNKNRQINKTCKAVVEIVDIFPTIAEVCGLNPEGMEGTSILPFVKNPSLNWNKAAYNLYPKGKNIMGFSCTDGKFRYTEWWSNKDSKVLWKELWSCKQDYSQQAINLVKNTAYDQVTARMEKLLEKNFPLDKRSSYPQLDEPRKKK